MGESTAIAWTDQTWNPWRGCTKISPGCENCYMFTAQERYGRDPSVVVRTKTWGEPARWNRAAQAEGRPRRVFTCSWSDWFHNDADAWRAEAWAIIRSTPWLQYQILTKRSGRIAGKLPADWGAGYPNVWLGVSVESDKFLWRMDDLRKIAAAVRFISYEPALGPIAHSLNLDRIDWVIQGGESGPGFRAQDLAWAHDVRALCAKAGVAYFFKQASAPRTEMGIDALGEIVREYPTPRGARLLA